MKVRPIIQNVIAVGAGILLGFFTNLFVLELGQLVFPPPPGVNPDDIDSVRANMHLYEPLQMLPAWLAHALGTLSGAILTAYLAAGYKWGLAAVLTFMFFMSGVANFLTMPETPSWFVWADLLGAYWPFWGLGGAIGIALSRRFAV